MVGGGGGLLVAAASCTSSLSFSKMGGANEATSRHVCRRTAMTPFWVLFRAGACQARHSCKSLAAADLTTPRSAVRAMYRGPACLSAQQNCCSTQQHYLSPLTALDLLLCALVCIRFVRDAARFPQPARSAATQSLLRCTPVLSVCPMSDPLHGPPLALPFL